MKLAGVLEVLGPVVGMTSLLAAPGSVDSRGATGIPTLEQARDKLALTEKSMHDSQSDAAYWGYQGQVSYWRMMVSLLKAAELVGPDALPDEPLPDVHNDVVMDACSKLERFGEIVLLRARNRRAIPHTGP